MTTLELDKLEISKKIANCGRNGAGSGRVRETSRTVAKPALRIGARPRLVSPNNSSPS